MRQTEESLKVLAWSLGRVLTPIVIPRKIYAPEVFAVGHRIYVQYANYAGQTAITRKQAVKYLRWLLAGNRGRHWDCFDARRMGQ